MSYIKKPSSLVVINNDEEQLLSVMSMRSRSKEMQQLRKELALMRKEFDQLKMLVLDKLDGGV